MAKKADDHSKTVAILSYIVIGLVWYLADDKVHDDFTKYHVKQGLVLLIAYVAAMAVSSILFFISFILVPIVGLVSLVLVILGMVNASNNKKVELPIIGGFAEKFKF